MAPKYDSRGRGLTEDDLKRTPYLWRCHRDAGGTLEIPIEFVWKQVLRTEDYHKWSDFRLSPVPDNFTIGTYLTSPGGVEAVVGKYHEKIAFHVYYGVSLLVLEIGGGERTDFRLCYDVFYKNRWARFRANEREHEKKTTQMANRFMSHCKVAYINS